MSLPKTFKIAIFKKINDPLTFEDVDLKEPTEGEVLIKVLATGVCHSDADVQVGGFGNPFPMVPGHEVVGDVVAVGPGEKIWKIGDRVGGGWHGGHDGTCKQCKRGLFQMCSKEEINGVTRWGGYAEYCTLRTEAVVSVPKEADPAEVCPLLCAGVTVFNGMRRMKITPGETVGIQGLGGLGHLAVQYASKMGYRVVALSSSASKEKFAKDLGASDYVDGSKTNQAEFMKGLGGAALIVSTAPNPDVVGELVGGLAGEGKLLILSPSGDVSVSTIGLIMNGSSVHGWPSGHALDSEEAIKFAELHNVKCMVERFPFAEAQKAFDHMKSGKARFRAVLTMT